ncbi:thiamine pyrophosphate-dependent dehydrogenase E1 component subunit alpha [Aliibacillus thermotolerans]|uniref:2-oxoisovalerate dehydrogenase subunit alpha n=1 Tax=Aliibacillus thermotolerans TaxID=1834418 RepID=A0ABW0U9A6_9BACI|nr:thiamine pyrophosphate-dependent dehydrogenase E1 component subunit alpha [Aliibacillus thermotolerans]MDA3131155.1 thiamine pyrophosphate-dependent dehydrogenase E1 component subunit alpha [Aliibacillus thermotolerans]
MTKSRHQQLGLSDEKALEMYETMLLARKLDERLWLLNRAGKIHFVISCQGQEGVQVATAMALDKDKDYILPYYRDLGMVLQFGMTVKEVMLHSFAKATDPNSGGRQMPSHFGQRKNRIVTGSSPVTTQVPHAVGFALAAKMQQKDFVTLTSFGEGSSNQGDFHEGLNFAGVHQLPVVFLCENNQYAISVPTEKQLACEKVSDRAVGYGMKGVTIDGNDPLTVYEVMKEAVDRARLGGGPSLIETVSYRFTPHSSDDNDAFYRDKEEIEQAREKDSLVVYRTYLKDIHLLTDEKEKEINSRVAEMIDEATTYAEEAKDPDPHTLLHHVYGTPHGGDKT